MKCLLVFVFVAALCATGEALRCYQCSSGASPSCNDPFDKSGAGVSEYEFGSSCLCAKMVYLLNGKARTERTCMSITAWTRSQASRSSGDNLSANFCDTDLCNGATAAQITLALLAAPLIFMIWQ